MFFQIIPHVTSPAPKGNLQCLHMQSNFLGGNRRIWIYTPYNFTTASSRLPILLFYDGAHYLLNTPILTVFDNLIASSLTPPFVAGFIGTAKNRRLKELTYNKPLIQHLTLEVIPWIRTAYNASEDPQQTLIGGQCLGGTMAIHTALRRPDLIGNVLCQSAAIHCSPFSKNNSHWLVKLLSTQAKLPLRFCLDVDINKNIHLPTWNACMLNSNRQLRDLLRARGYPLCYTEYSGSRDMLSWRNILSDSLTRLLKSKNNIAGTYWRAIEINAHQFTTSQDAAATTVA